MPASARVWVYKASRFLDESEAARIEARARAFTGQWAAHGKPLTATAFVQDQLWLVFVVDESKEGASGCSIDTVFRLVQDLESELGLRLTNRLLLAYEKEGDIALTDLQNLENIDAGTIIYDDTVQTLGEWQHRRKKASESWLNRYI